MTFSKKSEVFQKNSEKIWKKSEFFIEKHGETFVSIGEVSKFAGVIERASRLRLQCLGYGVIGNTADSGPAFPGSSPGTPTTFIIYKLKCGNETRLIAAFFGIYSQFSPCRTTHHPAIRKHCPTMEFVNSSTQIQLTQQFTL